MSIAEVKEIGNSALEARQADQRPLSILVHKVG